LLTDDDLWHRIAAAGAQHADLRHGVDLVEQRFADILERVMSLRLRTSRAATAAGDVEKIRHRVQVTGRPDEVVLVACGEDRDLLDGGGHPCWPFPQAAGGSGVGPDPVDGPAAVNHLEAQRARGARYFVLPRSAFGWRRRYPELIDHLETRHRRLHHDEHLVVYDLAPDRSDVARLDPVPNARVVVHGTYAAHRSGPRRRTRPVTRTRTSSCSCATTSSCPPDSWTA